MQVRGPADAVGEQPGHVHPRIERAQPQAHRGDRARDRPGVDHRHHWRL
jgi:hypothetical protein